jgi:hypothetical protein
MKLVKEAKVLTEALMEDQETVSELQKLLSTEEGRITYDAMSSNEQSALLRADKTDDEINELIWAFNEFEFEYDGFEDEWYEDHFNPNSWYGHYQTGGSGSYDDYTYTVDATIVFEVIRDTIIPEYASKKNDELASEGLKLYNTWNDALGAAEELITCWAYERFLAENLDIFVDIFYDELHEYYEDDAKEWALDHVSFNRY